MTQHQAYAEDGSSRKVFIPGDEARADQDRYDEEFQRGWEAAEKGRTVGRASEAFWDGYESFPA